MKLMRGSRSAVDAALDSPRKSERPPSLTSPHLTLLACVA